MGSQIQQKRNGCWRPSFGDNNTQEKKIGEYFCEEIREFKILSRSIHDFIGNSEGCYGPREFDLDEKILRRFVEGAHGFEARYFSKGDENVSTRKTKDLEAENRALVDKIMSVSRKLAGESGKVKLEIVYLSVYVYNSKKTKIMALFKVYGRDREALYISKNQGEYDSLLQFMDNNDLPHSLVCAAREGSERTYEMDSEIKKFPLTFYTVNYWKNFDRMNDHLLALSQDLSISLLRWSFPMKLVWVAGSHALVELEYYVKNLDFESMIKTSTLYKFNKFLEKCCSWKKVAGRGLNAAIIASHEYYATIDGTVSNSLFSEVLLMIGNQITPNGAAACTKLPIPRDISLPAGSSESFWIGIRFFRELIGEFGVDYPTPRTTNSCIGIILDLCCIGEKLMLHFEDFIKSRVPKTVFEISFLGLRFVRYIIMVRGMAEDKVLMPKDEHSLKNFLKNVKQKDIDKSLASETNGEKFDEAIARQLLEDVPNYTSPIQFVTETQDATLYISQASLPVSIEKLLEELGKPARVYSPGNGRYEISSDKTFFKICQCKTDRPEREIQFIYAKKI